MMIAAVSPADYNYDETLSTLRYASRAKNIKNKPVINEDPKDALLRQYEEEIHQLKEMLKQLQQGKSLDKTLMKKASNTISDEIMFEDSISSLIQRIEEKGKKVRLMDDNGEEEDKIDLQRSLHDRIIGNLFTYQIEIDFPDKNVTESPSKGKNDNSDTQKVYYEIDKFRRN